MTSEEIARYRGSKAVFIRVQLVMAIIGAVLITGGLVLAGNPDWWVGIVGSFAGIGMRGYYIADEQLAFEWVLTNRQLLAPNERAIGLNEIATVRHVLGSVQVITHQGDKFLIKYQSQPEHVIAEIKGAVARA